VVSPPTFITPFDGRQHIGVPFLSGQKVECGFGILEPLAERLAELLSGTGSTSIFLLRWNAVKSWPDLKT
jgi:hypothetical protein